MSTSRYCQYCQYLLVFIQGQRNTEISPGTTGTHMMQ